MDYLLGFSYFMFRTLFNFSDQDRNELNDARTIYIDALKARSANPSNFHCNIECLKEFEKSIEIVLKIMISRHENLEHANEIIDEDIEVVNFFNVVKKLIFDVLTTEIIIAEMLKEPRITELSADVRHNKKTVNNQVTQNFTEREYTITFSDHSEMKLNNLTPETLSENEAKFREKMDELAITPTRTMTFK